MSPHRIQLRRTAGWRKPEGAVVVSRPSRWGNPFMIKPVGGFFEVHYHLGPGGPPADDSGWQCVLPTEVAARAAAAYRFAAALRDGHLLYGPDQVIDQLAGRDLACWCPPGPCHADVLLEVANPR